jgi:hypothetical protein
MDFIKELISTRGAGMLSELMSSGFDAGQAQRFLPEASESIMGGIKGVDLSSLLKADVSSQVAGLLGNIDIGGLASRAGVDDGLARTGLEKLIPMALGFLKDNQAMAGLMGLMDGKGDGIAGLARGLFH